MMQTRIPKSCLCVAVVAMAWLCGCSPSDQPPLGRVTGTITLDDKPLLGAGISFQQQGFRPSLGMTDAQGRYELKYLRETMGAAVGRHEVKIDTIPQQEGVRRARLPARYNSETTLSADVKKGKNVIDFELTSDP